MMMKFSSFFALALVEKLWLPVITTGSSENGSITRTLLWTMAWPMLLRTPEEERVVLVDVDLELHGHGRILPHSSAPIARANAGQRGADGQRHSTRFTKDLRTL